MLKTEVHKTVYIAISADTIPDVEAYDLITEHEYLAEFTEGDEVHIPKDDYLYERILTTAPGTTYIIGIENPCFADNIVLCKQAPNTWVIADTHQPITPNCAEHLTGSYFEIYPLS